jgi:transposase
MRGQGMTIRAIAKRVGHSESSVLMTLEGLNDPPRQRVKHERPRIPAEVLADRARRAALDWNDPNVCLLGDPPRGFLQQST